jgi:hypothetical protein
MGAEITLEAEANAAASPPTEPLAIMAPRPAADHLLSLKPRLQN